MENLWIYSFTVLVYLIALLSLKVSGAWTLKQCLQKLALLAVLCLPLNINGNIWTVFGNAVSEKNVYSVCSLYQEAKGDAISVVGLGGYQQAGQNAIIIAGISGYQLAKQEAVTGFGVAVYQKAAGPSMLVGLAGYQEGKDSALILIGLVGCQKGENSAAVGTGLAGYQKATKEVQAKIGLALYQQVKGKSRTFGAFTALKAD